jgi:hypothetical protein
MVSRSFIAAHFDFIWIGTTNNKTYRCKHCDMFMLPTRWAIVHVAVDQALLHLLDAHDIVQDQ